MRDSLEKYVDVCSELRCECKKRYGTSVFRSYDGNFYSLDVLEPHVRTIYKELTEDDGLTPGQICSILSILRVQLQLDNFHKRRLNLKKGGGR